MEGLEETSKNISSKMGFFKHVFNFDDDSKSEMLNIVQYAIIAIVPIIVLNKLSQKYVPEADEEKGSLEILAEVIIQVLVIFLGILIVNRMITYVPTYSGVEYPEFSVIYIILAVLMITLSLQTKLGEKVSIIVDRVNELWEGKMGSGNDTKKGKKKGNVKVSQPIAGQQNGMIIPQQSQSDAMAQSMYGGGGSTSISQLPSSQEQQAPDYNSMYQNNYTPMPGAATPGGQEAFVPMAANEGGAFGSPFGGGF